MREFISPSLLAVKSRTYSCLRFSADRVSYHSKYFFSFAKLALFMSTLLASMSLFAEIYRSPGWPKLSVSIIVGVMKVPKRDGRNVPEGKAVLSRSMSLGAPSDDARWPKIS